jgi:hypothetical protein
MTSANRRTLPARLAWAALSIAGCLAGCGPQESSDGTPPDHIINLEKAQGKYRFGVTDTIVFDFSEEIDTSALVVAFDPKEGIAYDVAPRRLRIYGKNAAHGSAYFNINSPFSATLSGLRDLAGNGRSSVTESFQPYTWVDRDNLDSAFDGYDSLFLNDSIWVNGTPATDSLITEGALDFKQTVGRIDYQDVKIIEVQGGDTLLANLATRKDLNLTFRIAGPFSPVGFDSTLKAFDLDKSLDSANTGTRGSAFLKATADLGDFKRKFGNSEAKAFYALFISIPQSKEGFYRIGARIKKFH